MTLGISIDPQWKWANEFPIAQAIRIKDMLFISGQVALSPKGDLEGEGDVRQQTRQVFSNISALIKLHGGNGLDNLVTITTYLTDRASFAACNQVREEILGEHRPASTTVLVAGLAIHGLLIEMDAIAWLPSSWTKLKSVFRLPGLYAGI